MIPASANDKLALLNAVKENNTAEALKLLSICEDLMIFDDDKLAQGWSILHWAVYHKDVQLIEAICSCEKGRILINKKSSNAFLWGLFNWINGNQTALHIATSDDDFKKHDKNIIKILLRNGANPNIKDEQEKLAISSYLIGDIHNRCTIRLWTKCLNKNQFEVGHITLQTYVGGETGKGIYASFWPPPTNPESDSDHPLMTVKSNDKGYLRTYLYDKIQEGRDPDKIIDLYGLDINAINNAFHRFLNTNFNWSLFASTLFGIEYTCNCSGLIGLLLKTGGLESKLNDVDETILQGYSKLASSMGKTTARGLARTRVNNPVTGLVVLGAIVSYGIYNMLRANISNFLMPDDLYDLAEILHKHQGERLLIVNESTSTINSQNKIVLNKNG